MTKANADDPPFDKQAFLDFDLKVPGRLHG